MAVLKYFNNVEVAFGRQASKKRPPSPLFRQILNLSRQPPTWPTPVGFVATLPDLDDSSLPGPAHENVLVDPLVTSVRKALKI